MWRKAHQNASNDDFEQMKMNNMLFVADPESRMERRVYFQSEGGRAQAGVAGVRWESFDTGRFPWNGRNSIGEFAKRTGKSCRSTEKLSVASTKVSWVCFYVVFICVAIHAFYLRHEFISGSIQLTHFSSTQISARSRVRGTLEVYHAFIRDLDASDTSSSANLEQDWEIVTDGESEHDGEPEAHAQVNTQLASK